MAEEKNKKPANALEVKEKTKVESNSELRQDIVSGDYVVIATGRAKRPEDFKKMSESAEDNEIESCLFENPEQSNQEKDVLIYRQSNGEWTLRVFPNKYPAFVPEKEIRHLEEGPYFAMSGYGYHEVIVTRDHYKQLALMETLQIAEVFDAYQERYISLMNKKNVNFIGIFHNHGKEAGASIAHPHSQLMAIPVISPYIQLELDGADRYYRRNRNCAFCAMRDWEEKNKERMIFENEAFMAFCPFASRAAFEINVMPKKHSPYFERVSNEEKIKLAEVFGKALSAIYNGLGDPSYNFYIHTSPCDGKDYSHFHWHIEILPHTAIWAGFELQTGIEICVIQPEKAAEYLRKHIRSFV